MNRWIARHAVRSQSVSYKMYLGDSHSIVVPFQQFALLRLNVCEFRGHQDAFHEFVSKLFTGAWQGRTLNWMIYDAQGMNQIESRPLANLYIFSVGHALPGIASFQARFDYCNLYYNDRFTVRT